MSGAAGYWKCFVPEPQTGGGGHIDFRMKIMMYELQRKHTVCTQWKTSGGGSNQVKPGQEWSYYAVFPETVGRLSLGFLPAFGSWVFPVRGSGKV